MRPIVACLCLGLALAGCANEPESSTRMRVADAAGASAALPPPAQCAPFAREIAGIDLRGDAWTWWLQAAGHYERGQIPRPGAVLVLRGSAQLPHGHVAVVRRVFGPREIAVTQADWGGDDTTRRLIHDSQPVFDASPANDWSEPRFWNASAGAYGRIYPAYGFIYPREIAGNNLPVR